MIETISNFVWDYWFLTLPIFFLTLFFGIVRLKTLPENHIMAITKGESHWKMLVNVEGHYFDTKDSTIKKLKDDAKPPALPWYTKLFGIYWAGYRPIHNLLLFPLEERRIEENSNTDESGLQERFCFRRKANGVTEHFPFEQIVPIRVQGVELEGNITIDLFFQLVVQLVEPKKLSYKYATTWYDELHSFIAGEVADFLRAKEFDEFRTEAKTKTEDITSLSGYTKERITEEAKKVFGFVVMEVDYIGFNLSSQSDEIIRSITAKAVAERNLKAARINAQAEAAPVREIAEARALEFQRKIEIAKQYGGDGWREVLATLTEEQMVIGFKGATLVLNTDGSAKTTPIVLPAGERGTVRSIEEPN